MNRCMISIMALLICVSTAQAQGNFQGGFTFRNFGGVLGGDSELKIRGTEGNPLPNKSRFKVEALVGPPSGDLTQVATTNMASHDVPGFFNGRIVPVPGFEQGEEADFNIRAWDMKVGATFAEAKSAGVGYGSSGRFTVTLGGLGGPLIPPGPIPDPPAGLLGFKNFSLVPEPSTIVLAVLGIGALVVRRWAR